MGQAPSYRERSDKLIEEVKDMFKSMSLDGGELFSPFNDLLQRLWVVDSLQRLGIDSHFKNEIKSALDYVYRSATVDLLSLFFHSLYMEYT